MAQRTRSLTSPMAWRCMSAVPVRLSLFGWRELATMTLSYMLSTWRGSNSSSLSSFPLLEDLGIRARVHFKTLKKYPHHFLWRDTTGVKWWHHQWLAQIWSSSRPGWCSYETQQPALLMSPGLDSVSNCCSVLIHYPLQIFASFPLSTYSISPVFCMSVFHRELLLLTLSYPSFCLVHDCPSFLLTEYLQCWVLYSFIQGKEVSVLHLKILWTKSFLFPFYNFTIQGWLQGCTVMLHFVSWHFIMFLFDVKLWFSFFLSYFFCWPDCIPACLGLYSVVLMHAALSCREMIMANFNWHIPHLQQFAPFRCCTNFKQRGLKCIVVRGSCTPAGLTS